MAGSFAVDPQWLGLIARRVDIVADNLAGAEGSLRSCPPAGPEVFGGDRLVAAYREFFELWTAEVRTAAEAADQVAGALRRAAEGYQLSDGGAAARFGSH